jgi:hypothetical protein
VCEWDGSGRRRGRCGASGEAKVVLQKSGIGRVIRSIEDDVSEGSLPSIQEQCVKKAVKGRSERQRGSSREDWQGRTRSAREIENDVSAFSKGCSDLRKI